MTPRASRLAAQIVALLLIVVSITCCLCGSLISTLSLLPIEGEAEFLLPTGKIATPEQVQRMAFGNTLLFIVFALTIMMIGVAIWFVFGREQSTHNRLAKAISVFSLLGCASFSLWAILVAITGFLLDGMLPTGDIVGPRNYLIGTLFCLIPAIILGVTGIAVWLLFGPKSPPALIEKEHLIKTQAISLQAYLAYMENLLNRQEGADGKVGDSSAQARTLMVLREATKAEKEEVLKFLAKAKLIMEPPMIKLAGVDLSGINMAESDWQRINLAGANLRGADLHAANLEGANLQATTLHAADLRFADLRSANLQEADLRQAKLHRANFRLADLRGANLAQANLWQADLSDAQVTNEQLQAAKTLKEATLPDKTHE